MKRALLILMAAALLLALSACKTEDPLAGAPNPIATMDSPSATMRISPCRSATRFMISIVS